MHAQHTPLLDYGPIAAPTRSSRRRSRIRAPAPPTWPRPHSAGHVRYWLEGAGRLHQLAGGDVRMGEGAIGDEFHGTHPLTRSAPQSGGSRWLKRVGETPLIRR